MEKIKLNKFKLFDMLGYKTYHKEVERFHRSESKVKVCSAPRRSTKSYSASYDALDTILLPDTRTWIVGPSYGLAEKEFRYIHDILVIKRDKLGLPKPKICMTNPRSGQLFIKFAWNAVVEGKTADRPDSLLGEAVDVVIYSEAAQLARGIRERYVAPTLITKQGREIVPTTPDGAAEWVHELVEKGNQGYDGIDSFHWDVTANPDYPMEEYEHAKKFYGANSPVFREQYLGEWVFYGGLVYPTFSDDSHVIEPFDIPQSWKRIRAIDFGHRDPFVCLWFAIGPKNEIYLYREYYQREGRSIREHALTIKALSSGEYISMTVGDPQAKQSIDDLCYEGIPCIGANHDRTAGRLRVLEYILPTDDGPVSFSLKEEAGKHPRFYVFNTAKETVREFKYYRWVEGANREGEKERTEGEDHAMDPIRYGMMTRPSPFRIQSKFSTKSWKGWFNRNKKDRIRETYIGGQVG